MAFMKQAVSPGNPRKTKLQKVDREVGKFNIGENAVESKRSTS